VGSVGPQGIQGIQGPPGPAGISGYELSTNRPAVYFLPPGTPYEVKAECPPGKKILSGGGFVWGNSYGWPLMVHSGPYNGTSSTGWMVKWYNSNGSTIGLGVEVYAICAVVP
jgi:hypothetical protein